MPPCFAVLRFVCVLIAQSGDARLVHSDTHPQRQPKPSRPALRDDQAIRVDFRDIWKETQTLAASSYTGKDKKVYEAEQIRALGGRVEWKEKMPHKMWLGVTKARKAKAARLAAEAKAAGLVTGRPGASAIAASKPKERRWRKGGVDDGITPDDIRGPVMHVRPTR